MIDELRKLLDRVRFHAAGRPMSDSAWIADELAAVIERGGWRPIETAPDYQAVLIYVPPFDPIQATRSGKFGTWMVGARSLLGHDLPSSRQPTHWMPLPPPPGEQP